MDEYTARLNESDHLDRNTMLGIEGNAAKVYFPRIFDNTNWKSRKSRIKFDYINSLLDMADISNKYEKRFSQEDSVIIFILSKTCKTVRYGYAKNDESNLIMIT